MNTHARSSIYIQTCIKIQKYKITLEVYIIVIGRNTDTGCRTNDVKMLYVLIDVGVFPKTIVCSIFSIPPTYVL